MIDRDPGGEGLIVGIELPLYVVRLLVMSIRPSIPGLSRSALEEAQRIMRQQDEMLRLARGPLHDLQQAFSASQGPLAHYEALRRSGALDQLGRASELYEERRRLLELVEPNWLRSINDAARRVNQFDMTAFRHLETLSDTLALRADAAAKALRGSEGLIAIATANAPLPPSYQELLERITSEVTALRAFSEMALTAEMKVLRAASDDPHVERVHALRLQVLAVEQLTIELQETSQPERRAGLLAQIVGSLADTLRWFRKNTTAEFAGLGLLALVGLLSDVKDIVDMALPKVEAPAFTEADRQQIEQTHATLQSVQDAVQQIEKAVQERDDAFLADLPRGTLRKATSIRTEPRKTASRILVANAGTHLAIAETSNGWSRIYYKDPLTDDLATGWVPNRSVVRF